MPKLITEILREIFIQLVGNDLQNVKHVEKLMLSGKENFKAVLNFFSTAKRFIIIKDGFRILYPSGQSFVVSYDTVILKSILKAIAKSVVVEFRERPAGAAENIVYDALITEGLKSVHFSYGHVLPDIYMEKIKNLVSLESASFYEHSLSLYNFSIVRPLQSSAFIHLDFADLNSQLENICFPHVENLDISGIFYCTKKNLALIKKLIATIFKIFPNLKIFNATFGNMAIIKPDVYNRLESSLKAVLETMELVNPEMFVGIPENVNGVFNFQCLPGKKDVFSIKEKFADKEGYKVTDHCIEKYFIIHEGMQLSFCAICEDVCIDVVEESDEDSEIEDYDSEMEIDDEE